jgi:hypothetical protein
VMCHPFLIGIIHMQKNITTYTLILYSTPEQYFVI